MNSISKFNVHVREKNVSVNVGKVKQKDKIHASFIKRSNRNGHHTVSHSVKNVGIVATPVHNRFDVLSAKGDLHTCGNIQISFGTEHSVLNNVYKSSNVSDCANKKNFL